jgi:hypothetical protein
MVRRGLIVGLALAVALPAFVAGAGATCFSCCPAEDGKVSTLTSPDCCGNDCAPRMRDGGTRPCALTQRASAADALTSVTPASPASDFLTASLPYGSDFLAFSSPSHPVLTPLRL